MYSKVKENSFTRWLFRLLDEVNNIVLLLTFNKVDLANVNEYAMKVANDYAYQNSDKAEEAVLRIESVSKRQEDQNRKLARLKTNVPEQSRI